MIPLTENTGAGDILEIILTEAQTTAMPCIVCYRDIDTSTYTPGRTVSSSNGITAAPILAKPAASHQRIVDLISAYNADNVTHNVTIRFNANGTTYTLWKGALLVGETLRYEEKSGWRRYDTNALPVESYPVPPMDVQIFTAGSGNWTKPTWFTSKCVYVVCIGAGGGGGGGGTNTGAVSRNGGCGGGGGSYVAKLFRADEVATGGTEAYVVGVGGTLGAASGNTAGNGGGEATLLGGIQ